MNTPPDPQTKPLLESRKFKALILAVILIGLPIIGSFAMLGMGRINFDQMKEMIAVAFGSVAVITSVFIGAVAHEDAAKGTSPINAGGNVTVTQAPPGGSMPPAGGGTTFRDVPPPPAAPTGFGSFAPVSRKVKIAARTLMALALTLAGCTGIFKQDARTALDVEQAACVLANIALDVPALRTVCRISDALDPELEKLLAAGRKVAATKGAPICRDAGAP